ncbi:flagellar biosynthesis anti-sigma factor FlgM [Allosphingosinicella sp.]|uniref:flagellar biosynthesis anti-sigma factor FlgM n=1 Tax=Allosphingosinicella sp. TaxID=2823234 RepID=UPI003783C111
MIDGVGKGGTGRIDLSRQEKGASVSPLKSDGSRAPDGAVKSAVLELVSGGAPVDSAKVEAVRAAIQSGRYPIDPDRIARRMLDLDLPRRD